MRPDQILRAAAVEAMEYWTLPQDQGDKILARLHEQGIKIPARQFEALVEALIALEWSVNGNDLVGFGWDNRDRDRFEWRQESEADFIVEQCGRYAPGTEVDGPEHEIDWTPDGHPTPSFWREALVGLAALGAIAAFFLLFALMGGQP